MTTVGVRPQRLLCIDAARGWAILGSVGIHVLIACSVWGQIDNHLVAGLGNAFFRACAPMFFILFGVLLELVYVRKCAEDPAGVRRRLLVRSAQCYLGFAIGVTAALVSQQVRLADALYAFVGAAHVPMISVLRFITIALLLAAVLVPLRARWGRWVPIACLAGIWVPEPWLQRYSWPDASSHLGIFVGKLIGHPQVGIGGSTLHNLGFVFYGMLLGQALEAARSAARPSFPNPVALVAIAAGIVAIGGAVFVWGVEETARGLLANSMPLRAAHHPVYYVCFAAYATAVLWLLSRAVEVAPWRRLLANEAVLALGRRSLVAFTLGNAGLNLVPVAWMPERFWLAGTVALLYLVAFVLSVRAYDRRRQARRRHDRQQCGPLDTAGA